MNLVIDTNVFVSGIVSDGPPHHILRAWQQEQFGVLITKVILEEYIRVGQKFDALYPGSDVIESMNYMIAKAKLVDAIELSHQVCSDRADDKFIACAIAAGAKTIISGDKALLKCSGFRGINVLKPREFLERYLKAV